MEDGCAAGCGCLVGFVAAAALGVYATVWYHGTDFGRSHPFLATAPPVTVVTVGPPAPAPRRPGPPDAATELGWFGLGFGTASLLAWLVWLSSRPDLNAVGPRPSGPGGADGPGPETYDLAGGGPPPGKPDGVSGLDDGWD